MTCKTRDSVGWLDRWGSQTVPGSGVPIRQKGNTTLRCQIDASVAVRRADMMQKTVREEKVVAVHYVLEGVDVQVYMDDEEEMTFLRTPISSTMTTPTTLSLQPSV